MIFEGEEEAGAEPWRAPLAPLVWPPEAPEEGLMMNLYLRLGCNDRAESSVAALTSVSALCPSSIVSEILSYDRTYSSQETGVNVISDSAFMQTLA